MNAAQRSLSSQHPHAANKTSLSQNNSFKGNPVKHHDCNQVLVSVADNKFGRHQLFDEYYQGRTGDLIEMDQRQRIFEEIIISRIKVVQDFVKQKFDKLSKQMRQTQRNQLIVSGTERLDLEDLKNPNLTAAQAGSRGSIIEVVEEALKWRLEANNRKQAELMEELVEKTTANKKHIEVLQNASNNEFIEIKNQIVEAVADILTQVQDNVLPSHEKQLILQIKAQLLAPQ